MCTYLYLRNQHILSRLEISGILFANELDTHSRTGFILYVVKIFKNATHSKSVKEFMKIEKFRDPCLRPIGALIEMFLKGLQSAVRWCANNARASEKCC